MNRVPPLNFFDVFFEEIFFFCSFLLSHKAPYARIVFYIFKNSLDLDWIVNFLVARGSSINEKFLYRNFFSHLLSSFGWPKDMRLMDIFLIYGKTWNSLCITANTRQASCRPEYCRAQPSPETRAGARAGARAASERREYPTRPLDFAWNFSSRKRKGH